MIALDMRTVMFANVIVNTICLIVLLILWYQNRDKYSGLFYLVIDWFLQAGGALLIALRGTVPDWASMVLSNTMIVGGTIILYFGLCRFAGKKNAPILKYLLSAVFAIFILIHTYFLYVHNELLARNYNISIGLALACLLGMWLMFKGVNPETRRISKGTGIAFAVIIFISLIRITGFSLLTQTSNDYLKSGMFDTLLVLLLTGAIVFLVFNLVLMVNRRIYIESQTMIEKNVYLASFPEMNPNPVVEMDREGYLTYLNPAARTTFPGLATLGVKHPFLADWAQVVKELESGNWAKAVIREITIDSSYYEQRINPTAEKRIRIYCLNITGRKQAEKELRQSEDKYRKLFESMAQGVVYQNSEGHILSTNAAAERILGLTLDQMQGRTSFDPRWKALHEDGSDFPGDTHPSMVALKTGKEVRNVIMGVFHPINNEYTWININAMPQFKQGETKPHQVYATFEDITERKQAEERLRESEKRYHSLFENMLNGFAYCQLLYEDNLAQDFIYLEVNNAFEILTGLKNVKGRRATEVIPGIKESNPELFGMYSLVALTGKSETFESYVSPLGIWLSISVYSSEKGHFVAIFENITSRKRADDSIREAFAAQKVILDGLDALVYVTDLQTYEVLFVNKYGRNIWGSIEGTTCWQTIQTGQGGPCAFCTNNRLFNPDGSSAGVYVWEFKNTVTNRWYQCRDQAVKWVDGRFVRMEVAVDITERKQATQALQASEENFRNSIDNSPLGMRIIDGDGKTLYANRAILAVYGYDNLEEMNSMPGEERHTPESYAIHQERVKKRMAGESVPADYTASIVRKNGEIRQLLAHIGEVLWNGQRQFQVLYQDITETKKAEEKLKESEERYRTLFEESVEGILIADIETRKFKYANPAICLMLGYSQEELTKMSVTDIHPVDSLEQVIAEFYAQARGEKELSTLPCLKKDGSIIYADIGTGKATIDRRECNIGFFTDVTERKNTEAFIQASLKEKETLLKEVHHRVKNNMQIISSLLRLQEGRVQDKDALSILKDSQNRIKSMALVYNKLYQAQNLARIGMADYIKELTAGLIRSLAGSPNRVTARIETSDVFLGLELAIPCGLVINELVTNSLKYAFPEGSTGEIAVSLQERGNRELELVISDNGVGMPEVLNMAKPGTLGLELVTNLVQDQLKGKMVLDHSQGTTFKITFFKGTE